MNLSDQIVTLIAYRHRCGCLVELFFSREQLAAMTGGSARQLRRARAIDAAERESDLRFVGIVVAMLGHRLIDAAKEKTFTCACGEVLFVAKILGQYVQDAPTYLIPYPNRELQRL